MHSVSGLELSHRHTPSQNCPSRVSLRLLSATFSPDRMSIVRLASRSHANDKPIVFLNQQYTLYGALPLFNSHREQLGVLLTVHELPSRSQIAVALFILLWPMLVIEAIRQIKKISPRSQIIVLTSFQEDEYIFPTLQAGTLSYLTLSSKLWVDTGKPLALH